MVRVHIYSKEDCHLCDDALEIIQRVCTKHPFEIIITKITERHPMFKEYSDKVPVVFVEGEQSFMYRVNEKALLQKIMEYEQ
ncbi:MAG: glutaredoxin family protein [Bacteroidota bacterium]